MLLLDSSVTEYIHLKAMVGDHHTIQLILEENASEVHATNGRMCAPPLFYASRFGHLRACEVLIRYGANVNDRKSGWTCLHEAAFANHPEVVRLLLEHGADTNALVGYSMKTPLMQAAKNGSSKVCQMLLECGADAWNLDINRKTAADMATNEECKEAILRNMRCMVVKSNRDRLLWGRLPDELFNHFLTYI